MTPGRQKLDDLLDISLKRLETVLERRDWLTGPFSVADMLEDVLRLVDWARVCFPPAVTMSCGATARPPFVKACLHIRELYLQR